MLVSSLCWIGACVSGFLGSIYISDMLLPHDDTAVFTVFGSAVLVCGLMWRRVVTVGWQLVGEAKSSLLEMAATLWLMILTGLLGLSALLITGGGLVFIAFSGSSQGGSWQ